MPCQITVVDCGTGNLNSVRKKLSKLDCSPTISTNANDIESADKLILPGVGHFGSAMDSLRRLDLLDALNEAVLVRRKPILGICLGMQLMATRSEEGTALGLGWFDAEVIKFQTQDPLRFKIPHIGWNQVSITKESLLMRNVPDQSEFYFVHSFHLKPLHSTDVLNVTEYEHEFVSAVERNNIMGVQYHPEKSHDVGEILLGNFVAL